MGLSAFKDFQSYLRQGYHPPQMGFKCKAGDINQFANRVRLARAFQGLELEGYAEDTIEGYSGFFQVFLTHASLERFLEINGHNLGQMCKLIKPYGPERIVLAFRETDPKRRLFDFLYKRLNAHLQSKLEQIYNADETNIGYLSASVRHIFAHGHLTAHASGINPVKVSAFCCELSDFLIEFMDSEFSKKISDFQANLQSESTS